MTAVAKVENVVAIGLTVAGLLGLGSCTKGRAGCVPTSSVERPGRRVGLDCGITPGIGCRGGVGIIEAETPERTPVWTIGVYFEPGRGKDFSLSR